MNITELTVKQLAKALEQKELSARDAAEAYFSAIGQKDGDVGAYLTVTRELALHQVTAVDEKRARGEKLPALAGIPCGIKDNICTRGTTTTCASKMLEHFVPPYDAAVMEKLQGQQALCSAEPYLLNIIQHPDLIAVSEYPGNIGGRNPQLLRHHIDV